MSLVTMASTPRVRLWSRVEYEKLVASGVFGPGDRVELLEGEVIDMTPEKSRHAAAVDLVAEALREAFGASHTIRVQHPLAISGTSEPQPDVAVVTGTARDYVDQHPTSAALVVEVSDSSLDYDRTKKARAYAQAGIAEYWIVNLVEGVVEVHCEPRAEGYGEVDRLTSGDTVSPRAASHGAVAVSDLLP